MSTQLATCVSARARARNLIEWADGLEAAAAMIEAAGVQSNLERTARRCRVVASDALELAHELELERVARESMQEERDRCRVLLGDRAGQAAKEGARAA